jgi:DNA invertase Pin-like site-specific DNA recombinase
MKQVAIYARVSTRDRQEAENQLRQLRGFIAKQDDWQPATEYIDRESGKHANRAGFQKMFDAASRHEFDILLFWSLDRLSREGVYETLQHLNRLTSYGIGWRSYSEPYLDSCGLFKDAVISILATLAKQERVRLSERVIAGLERARAEGRIGGRPPLPDTVRKKVLKLHSRGLSFGKIANELEISKMTASRIVAAGE